MATTLSELVALASKQHGLMTHEQATGAGLNRMALSRLVRSGVWQQVRPRVFRKAAKAQTEAQALMAVCLSLGEATVVSHRSAARLLGLDLEQGELEVTTIKYQRELEGVVAHRSKAMAETDRKVLRGIPVTTGARTIIDLASQLDEEQLAFTVEEAWRKEIAAPDWVRKRLKVLGKRGRSTGALAEILDDCFSRKKPLESAFEVKVWRLLKKHALPLPTPNYEFRDDFGQPGHVDFAYPEHHLAIECDSWEFHSAREPFENDRLRAARLAAVGWRVVPLTWRQVTDEPRNVVERLRHALKYRGQKI
jgi:very-short-patch-repair endonuclease